MCSRIRPVYPFPGPLPEPCRSDEYAKPDNSEPSGCRTQVTVSVTVTNAQGLSAKGALSFETVELDLKVLDRELRCRLSRFRNYILFVPEWKLIEEVEVRTNNWLSSKRKSQRLRRRWESVKSVIGRMNQRRSTSEV